MKIECKTATYKDIKAIKALWKEAFMDNDAYIEKFLKQAVRFDEMCIAKDADALAGMMFLLPAEIVCNEKTIPVAYLYAVATKKEYRGKGIMKKLESFACQKASETGNKAIVLVPQSKSLFEMYKKLSYETAFYKTISKVACTKRDNGILSVCDKNNFFELRKRYLKTKPSYFDLNKRVWEYRFDEFLTEGKIWLYNNEGKTGYVAVIYNTNDKSVLIKETDLGSNDMLNAAQELLSKYDALNVISLAEYGKSVPYGMIKFLDDAKEDIGNFPYMNFMLD